MVGKRKKRSLVRDGEPSQKTPKGLEIPIPTQGDFLRLLDKATQILFTALSRLLRRSHRFAGNYESLIGISIGESQCTFPNTLHCLLVSRNRVLRSYPIFGLAQVLS